MQLTDIEDVKRFVFGGNATFTLVSKKTGTRYTFKMRRAKKENVYFASHMVGSDNENSFTYLGYLRQDQPLRTGKNKTHLAKLAQFKALAWLITALNQNVLPSTVEFWHEGRCCRCNRKLTVPESIATGIGPECAKVHDRQKSFDV